MARTESILTDEEVLLAQALANLAVSGANQAIRKSGAASLANVNLTGATKVWGEVPSGVINGTDGTDGNNTFTLANSPDSGTARLYKSGIRQNSGAGNDYSISGTIITFNSGAIPIAGDALLVDYEYS